MAIDKKVNTRFTANKSTVEKRFGLMARASARFGRSADKSFKKANRGASRFSDITKGILAANLIERGFRVLKDGVVSFVTEASKIEDATAGFTPLLGSVTRAEELVEKLNQTAATTPFQFEGISDVAKQLLPVMNDSIDDTITTFRMLGDTAGGNMQKLDSITRGFTKALLKGKPDMEALNMIAEAGVPIFSEMSESMGITKAQLFEMSKQGKLTSDDLTKTFKKMTSEGGIFFRGMEIASKTFSGKMSTLRDNIALSAATIGQAFMPQLKDLADVLITMAGRVRAWAEANQGVISQGFTDFLTEVKEILPGVIAVMQVLGKAAMFIWKGFKFVGTAIGIIAAEIVNLWDKVSPIIDTITSGFGKTLEFAASILPKSSFDADFDPEAISSPVVAPNTAEAQANAKTQRFQGQLNIAGAPEGSSVETQQGVSGFNLALQGQN